MFILCPECGQALLVPDNLRDPLLRCKACRSTFRASAAQPAPSGKYVPADHVVPSRDEAANQPPLPEQPVHIEVDSSSTAERTRQKGKFAGLGTVVLIIFLLLAKAPRLLRVFQQDRRPRQVPARINEDRFKDIQRLLNEHRRPLPQPEFGITPRPAPTGEFREPQRVIDPPPIIDPLSAPKAPESSPSPEP